VLFYIFLTFDEFVRHSAFVVGFPNAAYFKHDLRSGSGCIVRAGSGMVVHVRFDAPAVQLVAQQMRAPARASHD
jgi:hypothetical protein